MQLRKRSPEFVIRGKGVFEGLILLQRTGTINLEKRCMCSFYNDQLIKHQDHQYRTRLDLRVVDVKLDAVEA